MVFYDMVIPLKINEFSKTQSAVTANVFPSKEKSTLPKRASFLCISQSSEVKLNDYRMRDGCSVYAYAYDI